MDAASSGGERGSTPDPAKALLSFPRMSDECERMAGAAFSFSPWRRPRSILISDVPQRVFIHQDDRALRDTHDALPLPAGELLVNALARGREQLGELSLTQLRFDEPTLRSLAPVCFGEAQ